MVKIENNSIKIRTMGGQSAYGNNVPFCNVAISMKHRAISSLECFRQKPFEDSHMRKLLKLGIPFMPYQDVIKITTVPQKGCPTKKTLSFTIEYWNPVEMESDHNALMELVDLEL